MASQNTDKYAFSITGGPSKFDLMVSLFEGNPKVRKTVSFKLEGLRREIQVAITGVQQEDGSGESWNIEGWVMGEFRANVKAYYSSRSRSGHFRFVVPIHSRIENGEQVDIIDVDGDKRLSYMLDHIREDLGRDLSDMIRNARRM